MKYATLYSTLAMGALLAGRAASRPHKIKREVVTEVVWTTTAVANVIVWVDEYGMPYTTETMEQVSVTSIAVAEVSTTSTVTFHAISPPSGMSIPLVTHTSSSIAVPPPPPLSSMEPISTPAQEPPLPLPAPVIPSPATTPEEAPTPAPAQPAPSPEVPVPDPTASMELSQTSFTNAYPSSQTRPPPSTAPKANPSSIASDGFPIGVTYDPFAGPSNCKPREQIEDEFDKMKTYGIVRIYGMGCDIVEIAIRKASEHGIKIMAGIYYPLEDIAEVVDALSNAIKQHAGGNWDVVSLVAVENEKVNSKEKTALDVVDALRQSREALRAAGYNGSVGAVETVPAMVDNPTICENSDMALVNVHAFFDRNCKAEDAGQFVKDQLEQVSKVCPNKRIIVTESGWPHQGDPNGEAIPSRDNQNKAIESLLSMFHGDLFLFNAFDSEWKTDWSGSYNAEKYWGFMGAF
ncbi:glycoside hydrolase [Lojkania enalia]|uniref:Glycoside hydrolase n=1 Tax=Lojkania enalia TaxID=147567 RepID=A0A9P4KFC2_9PLEO|nr:glycoside hydrolase [Didymosphaeria enalia]